MPKLTQQQWLEERFKIALKNVGWPYSDGPALLAEDFLSAWPSSPQGQAVKQVMEKAVAIDYNMGELQTTGWVELRQAIQAARKAGVG